ncbi:hypothetical protein GQX73_g9436 [Xylaria multiplex]|uniref:Uncharacterized protein n=1 Tax=Xylaria multiplex TaxID=323545 RepID=A0A7C8MNR6_9PEZI|nr:hypothetical protein GQX73_g9436 [Xylaria multiplex]
MGGTHELNIFECYRGNLLNNDVKDIWLVEFKDKNAEEAAARGWGLALVTEEDAVFLVPKIVDPNGPVIVNLRVTNRDETTTGVEKVMALTAAGYGRRAFRSFPMSLSCLLGEMATSRIVFFEVDNGRGLRHWLCSVLFWFSSRTSVEDQLHLKAVSLMRRCFKGGDTMEYMPIEAGRYNVGKGGSASDAISQSTDAIAQLVEREGF